jgi:CheY-like chemotaxis protein
MQLVAITGYGQPSDRQRALSAGFHEHLVKPVDPAQLRRVVEKAGSRVGG